MRAQHHHLLCCCILLSCLLSSCSSMITGAIIQPAVGNLQQQTDIELVCEGAPAYLLMLDSMLVSSPQDPRLLLTASQSYSAYASALRECGDASERRIPAIAKKAKFYGKTLLGTHHLPGIDDEELDRSLQRLDKGDVPEVFWGTFGWLTWVESQQGAPAAMADLVTIEKIMARILVLDPAYQGGSAHLFFGIYHGAKPVMFGGRPDLSRIHFEKALNLSGRRFLLTQTTYAATFARATMDQELHDALLQEVMDFPLESAPEFGLSNHMARSRAEKLLEENYFGE